MKQNIAKILFLSVSIITGVRSIQAGSDRGYEYFKKHDYEMAAAEFQRVLTQDEENSEIHEALGWCYYWLGRYDAAEAEFNRALALDPQSTGARNGLAEVSKWRYMIFNKAWRIFYEKDYQNALVVFQSILDDTTGRLPAKELWKVHSGIGWCYYYLQNYTSAKEEFSKILSVYKNNEYARKGLGFTLYRLGDYSGSRKMLQEALASHPEWTDVQSMIGWCDYAEKKYMQALSEFEKAVAINRGYADAHYGIGWSYYRLGEKAKAMDAFTTAIGLSPYHPANYTLFTIIDGDEEWWPLYKVFGWSYYRVKDFQTAADIFANAMKRIPDDPELKEGYAFSKFKLGDYQTVTELLKQLLKEGVDLPPVVETGVSSDGVEYTVRSDILSILAWCRYYSGDIDSAEKMFRDEWKKHPDWADLPAGIGWCQFKRGNIDEAEKFFSRSLELNAYYTVALSGKIEVRRARYADYNQAWDAYYSGDKQAALLLFQKIVDSGLDKLDEADRWHVFSGMGWCLLDLGRYREARTAFKKALEYSDSNFYAVYGLARAHYHLKDWDKALKQVNAALALNSEASDLWRLKGWILFEKKSYTDAGKAFRRALEINAGDADAMAGLGWCQLKMKKFESARDSFTKALKIKPESEKAEEGLRHIPNQEEN